MERDNLNQCFRQIQTKLGWNDFHKWSDKQFNELADKIYKKTGVSISTKTLKRITGKIKLTHINAINYNPQLATKNALASFLGYKDWSGFINHLNKEEPSRKQVRPKPIFILILLVIAISGGIILYSLFSKPKKNNTRINVHEVESRISFSCENPIGTAPHNTLFNYNISTIKYDSVYIDYHDRYKIDPGHYDIKQLNKKKGSITYSYLMPDLYFPIIVVKNTTIKEIPVLVKSKGWLANVCYEDRITHEYRYKILRNYDIYDNKNQRLYLDASSLLSQKDIYKEHYYLEYRLIKEFGFKANDIIIEATFKNSEYEGGDNCQDFTFIGKCNKGSMKVKFLKPGCTQWAEFTIGDSTLAGNSSDMRHFGVMDNKKHTMKLDIKKNIASVFFDGLLIEEIKNPTKLGKFRGMIFVFKGVGSLYSVNISNQNNKVLYSTSFN
jgi:hypothetical protein